MGDVGAGQDFLDRVPVAAALVAVDGTVLAANHRLGQVVGRPPTALIGTSALPFVHPDDLPRIADELVAVATGQHPLGVAVPSRIRHTSGRWIEVTLTGLDLTAEPGFDGVLTTVRVPSHELDAVGTGGWFEAVVSGSDEIVQVVDEDGRFLWASGPMEHILGMSSETLIGRTIPEVRSDDDPGLAAAWFRSVVATPGTNPLVVGPRLAVDGTTVQLEVRANNLLHDPAVRGIVLHTRDITDRIRVEHANRFASEVIDRAPVAIATADAEGHINTWNKAAEELLGFSLTDVKGRRFRDVGIHTDDSFAAVLSSVDDIIAGGFVEIETTITDRHGTAIPTYLVISGMLDAAGAFNGYLLFGIDLRPERDARSALANSEARWITLSRNSQELVLLLEEDGTIRWAGGGFVNLLGLDPAALVGENARDHVHIDDAGRADGFAASVARGLPGNGVYNRTYRIRHADGRFRTFDISITDLRDEPSIGALLISGRDVTDRVEAEGIAERERTVRERHSTAVAALGQRALAGADVPDIMGDACELVSRNLEAPNVQVVLRTADRRHHEVVAAVGAFADTIGRRDPADDAVWTQWLDPAAGVQCRIAGHDGIYGFIGVLADEPRAFADAELAFLQAVANVLATAIERSQVSDEMRRRALHDELTGLPNRALLLDRLEQSLNRIGRRGGTVGLLFVDLDRFKRVNDTMGHGAGDEVLVATAARLGASVRGGDTVARTGGDEFLVLTDELVGPEDAVALAERVAAAVTAPIHIDGHQVFVSASVGVAVTEVEVDADQLVSDADLAMYRAKELGRARVQLFDATMRDEAVTRMAMEVALRDAVATDRIHVVFQPIVRLADGAPIGLEALARWDHPRLGAVPPASFVAMAEEIDLLDDITAAVLRSACRAVADGRELAPDLQVAVNLTARQLGRNEVLDLVIEAMDECALPHDALVIELTETGILDDRTALATLTALREEGFRVAIDDFGTGYSSLARLTRMPVDAVKIDRSFVSGVDEDQGCAAVVSATMSLAGVLGLDVVAEGVETEAQRARLLELGCTDGQGWLFSGPLDQAGVLDWLRRHLPG